MLLTALLIAHASAEWVEISQHHYRKPLRTYHFTTKANLEDTTKPWHNNSVTEYNWNKDRIKDATTKHYDNIKPLQDDEPDRFYYAPTIATGIDALKGTVERVPNVGNVKRVQLNNSPVKSPNIKWKSDRDKNPYIIDKDNTERVAHQETTDKQSYNYRIPVNNIKFLHTTATVPFLTNEKDEMLVTSKVPVENNHEFYNRTAINLPNHVFVSDDLMDSEKEVSRRNYNENKKTEIAEVNVYPYDNVMNERKPEIIKQMNHEEFRHSIAGNANGASSKSNLDTNGDIKTNYEAKYLHRKSTPALKEGLNKTTSKADTIGNLMRFMMVVTDTISKNSRRTFSGKMQYLQELKNNILGNIEDRIDATWPDDSGLEGSVRRRSRSARADLEPRGHVEFPSSESSLMTISFLTFAVFLIKLVLQVIQTYKNKTMMVAPLVVAAAGRAAYAHGKHN